MIAYRFERVRKPAKDAFAAVFDRRRLPVQDFAGAGHDASKGLADRLVTQANAEDRCLSSEVPDDRHADPSVARRSLARGEDDLVWGYHLYVLDFCFVVPHN